MVSFDQEIPTRVHLSSIVNYTWSSVGYASQAFSACIIDQLSIGAPYVAGAPTDGDLLKATAATASITYESLCTYVRVFACIFANIQHNGGRFCDA